MTRYLSLDSSLLFMALRSAEKFQIKCYSRFYDCVRVLCHLVAREAVWMCQFLQGLTVVPSSNDTITIYSVNRGAIFQAEEPKV